MSAKIQLYNATLKIGTLPLVIKRHRGSWAAFVPSEIDRNGAPVKLSEVAVCDFNCTKRRLRFVLAERYMAQVYESSETVYVNLRWAMKLPNWAGSYGALNELATAMRRAGLIKE